MLLLGVIQAQASGAAPTGISTFDLLSTNVLSGNESSVTFSSLDTLAAGYAHLQVRIVARSDEAGSSNLRDLRIQVNGDTSSSYSSHLLRADGADVYSSAATSQSSIFGGAMLPRPSNPTTQYGAAVVDILDWDNTSKYKTIRTLAGAKPDGEDQVWLGSGMWLNTNAITSITFFANSGNIATSSRFSIYGLPKVLP